MAETTPTPDQVLKSVGNLVDLFDGKDTSNRVQGKPNSHDCWYKPSCDTLAESVAALITKTGGSTYVEHTTEKAKQFSKTLTTAVFEEFRATDLPKLYGIPATANAYNHTSAQLMANHAYDNLVIKAAGLTLEAMVKYGTIRGSDAQALANLFAATKGSYTVQSTGAPASGTAGGLSDIVQIAKIFM